MANTPDKPLLERTYELLDSSDTSLPDLASGAKVGLEWLKKLRARAIEDPSVNRIQRLHDFLVSQSVPRVRQRRAHRPWSAA